MNAPKTLPETLPRTLIDTSSWIEALRRNGDGTVRNKVKRLLSSGAAVLCDMVILELWNGAQGDSEKKMLRNLQNELYVLPMDNETWSYALRLAKKCRLLGFAVPASDIVIASCAFRYTTDLIHCDSDFDLIIKANGKLD